MKHLQTILLAFTLMVTRTHASFEMLPDDLKLMIFAKAIPTEKDLCNYACVCRRFKKPADSDQAWQHLKPTYGKEIIHLMVTYCPKVTALYENELSAEQILEPSIKSQRHMYAITRRIKDQNINKEIERLALRVLYSSSRSANHPTSPEVRAGLIKLPSFSILDHFFLFAEQHSEEAMKVYIGRPFHIELFNITEASVTAQIDLFKRIKARHDYFFQLGSKTVKQSQLNFIPTMNSLGINLDWQYN